MMVSKPDPRTKDLVPRLQLWEPAQNKKMLKYYQDNLNNILHAVVIPTNAPFSYHREVGRMGEFRQVFTCKHGADLSCQVSKFMALHQSRAHKNRRLE